MEVYLKSHTKLSICAEAIRQCWDSGSKGGCYTEPTDDLVQTDKDLIVRIINKFKHSSTAEHLSYSFTITGISRACLQELARHRMTSLSVKSTRYTLTELKDENPFVNYGYKPHEGGSITNEAWDRAKKYLVFTNEDEIDTFSIRALDNLRKAVGTYSNDKAKYCLPEAYKTSLAWTINARSLQNFLTLRTSKSALWEIRELAKKLYEAIPEEHRYLFEECLYIEKTGI